ncbi:MAG: adenylate/guanylate cyclase domain-containing protein [Thermodesulfobacteriota bacterium]
MSGKKDSITKVELPEDTTIPARYIFYDIVQFTKNRTVEAQSEIIGELNTIILESVKKHDIPEDKLLLLPTGDGVCVVLLNMLLPYDVHLQFALHSLSLLNEYNKKTEDKRRKFEVRIGINENLDNLVIDINGRINIAGAGINMAQRIMNLASGGQILVSEIGFQTLSQHEKYLDAFRRYEAEVKHGDKLVVHQLIFKRSPGLNIDGPVSLAKGRDAKLTKLAAYYFAHAIKNEDLFVKKEYSETYKRILLLWLLARDSIGKSEETKGNPYSPVTYEAGKATLLDQYNYYEQMDFWLLSIFIEFITKETLSKYFKYFEDAWKCYFINKKGKEKLKKEWPEIWNEFELDNK